MILIDYCQRNSVVIINIHHVKLQFEGDLLEPNCVVIVGELKATWMFCSFAACVVDCISSDFCLKALVAWTCCL